ncbi:phytoene/squalene synthase family protein [Paenibacillus gansuensis]|uniref:Phytoene/squalene synthase family protein n=1 Tax=Paenibacillus gansuensis TaxID=306542 RepID=A0ABW5PDI4_9BACL
MERLEFMDLCKDVIAKGSVTFYKAFASLPSPKREAVHVIYAFCRFIDDSVDEPETSPFTLDELEQKFEHLETAQGHFIWDALRWLFREFPQVSKDPFRRQMEGQRGDIHFTAYDTMDQLEEYCYKVAGTVGEMLLPVLHDAPEERIAESGVYLGKAMQIANIVRDAGEDLARGRRYIPAELMAKHGYTEDDFLNKKITPQWRNLIEELSELSRLWFRIGVRDLHTYPAASRFSVALAAKYYEAILDKVKKNKYDSFNRRAVVTAKTKMGIFISLRSALDASDYPAKESWDVS